ncbi:MAG: bifunctional 4-hydroxy-2-oxoglutarate aldolase/2-dehydro-3-deoxy-phosphogluconate aldolase [Microbacteriaceae bacterium]|nr:bifunctional 4-hydroxy-2-oxoglutarate aldolase/2-dehydro-3-deoxy-phosphogluconate aldolase [Microbacteriaceae bacterium]
MGPDETLERARAAWNRGALVEVPVQRDEDWISLRAVLDHAEGRPVGAGTVVKPDQVIRLREEGVSFCVSPGWDPLVSEACERDGIWHLPGVATPTEVGSAWSAGYVWMKCFPASVLGPEWISGVLGPFPGVRFVCTGGMSEAIWPRFEAAGARVLAVGRHA